MQMCNDTKVKSYLSFLKSVQNGRFRAFSRSVLVSTPLTPSIAVKRGLISNYSNRERSRVALCEIKAEKLSPFCIATNSGALKRGGMAGISCSYSSFTKQKEKG